jgi:hypothetical protein
MIRDYAMKLLQGALFQKFRDQIMGVVPAMDPGPGKPPKEKLSEMKLSETKAKPSKEKGKILVLPEKEWHSRSLLGVISCPKDR